ncbi:glycosyl-transferase for dystroglycan-domain-containing protein [Zopfochytrium polystomum]|nr:glycosyl-transferase for dystroglycan-domain-containing protein [Zopfochytrium polystomum]
MEEPVVGANDNPALPQHQQQQQQPLLGAPRPQPRPHPRAGGGGGGGGRAAGAAAAAGGASAGQGGRKGFRYVNPLAGGGGTVPAGQRGRLEAFITELVGIDGHAPPPPRLPVVTDDDGVYAGETALPYITSEDHIVVVGGGGGGRGGGRNATTRAATDVTVATQTSLDRLGQIPELVRRWGGSVSVAVYVGTARELRGLDAALSLFRAALADAVGDFDDDGECVVTVSLLFGVEFLYVQTTDSDSDSGGDEPVPVRRSGVAHHPYDLLYPINALRNLAADRARTDLVFSLDADFVPSTGARAALTHPAVVALLTAHLNPAAGGPTTTATTKPPPGNLLVVPAFEYRGSPGPLPLPRAAASTATTPPAAASGLPANLTLAHLRAACASATIVPFHSRQPRPTRDPALSHPHLAAWCAGRLASPSPDLLITRAHLRTNYTQYLSPLPASTTPTTPSLYGLLAPSTGGSLDARFEPYVVGHRTAVPRFAGEFRGYAFNKRVQSVTAQARGCGFFVARGGPFVVHRPHAASGSKRVLMLAGGEDGGGGARGAAGAPAGKGREVEEEEERAVGVVVKRTVGRAYRAFLAGVRAEAVKAGGNGGLGGGGGGGWRRSAQEGGGAGGGGQQWW